MLVIATDTIQSAACWQYNPNFKYHDSLYDQPHHQLLLTPHELCPHDAFVETDDFRRSYTSEVACKFSLLQVVLSLMVNAVRVNRVVL